jgi:hypothetical protein
MLKVGATLQIFEAPFKETRLRRGTPTVLPRLAKYSREEVIPKSGSYLNVFRTAAFLQRIS